MLYDFLFSGLMRLLTALWVRHATAQRKARLELERIIKTTRESYQTRRDNLALFKELSKEYKDLGSNTNRTKIEDVSN